ncbi:MAG: prolipoprotein diacylglyceryl transferase [Acidobacteria bacterium]|nr:prolipoprotein diacylglyceryl transferase [Acidobacteriota bacterium]
MIPYPDLSVLSVPATQIAGRVLVALAIVLGHFLLVARARRVGLDPTIASVFSACLIGGGLLLGHWFKFLYWPSVWPRLAENPLALINVSFGQASLGGIVGGLLCGWLFLEWKAPAEDRMRYLDAVAFVFPYPWMLGRLHCALVHDHPGIRTTHWLGVRYPDGTRFDLAIVELLFLGAIVVLFLLLRRKKLPAGSLCALFLLSYGLFRILLDRLHVDPIRHMGLTVDQWGAAAAIAAGLLLLLPVVRAHQLVSATSFQLSEG